MTTSPDPILFLSGAGLRPWVWDAVRQNLSVATAVAPRPAASASASLLEYAEAAVAAAPPGHFAVVAHSVGGVVVTEVLRLVPERVSAFLGLSAAIPSPGGSFVSAMPLPNRWFLGSALRLGGTRPPESAIRRGLADGLDEETVSRIVADFTPESRGLYLDKTSSHAWEGRRGYITTSRDRELPAPLQERFARRLGAEWRDELPAGHVPMLHCPAQTADSIRRFVEA
jgi:pimeloyl-ACP methyl ester carboxylesterase